MNHQEPSLRCPYWRSVALPSVFVVLLSLFAGSLFGASQSKIVGADALGTDVVVQVEWAASIPSSEWVLLELSDIDGLSIAHQWVLPEPGEASMLSLNSALQGAISRSPHHVARLQGADGVEVAAPYPMQVMLACADPSQCAYEIDGGHAAPQMIYMRPAMEAALQEAKAQGARDLLRFVLDQRPELAGDVYSTAWQMGITENTESAGCTCQWTMTVDEQDSDCNGTCGSTHYVSVERGGNDHPVVSEAVNGSSTMTVDLECWGPSAGGTESVFIEGEGSMDLEIDGMGPCTTECGGSVLYRGIYDVEMGADTGAPGDSAVVVDTATFSVGSVTAFNRQFTFGVGGGLDDTTTDSETQSAVTVPGTSAVMASSADVSVYYTPFLPPFQGGGTESGGVHRSHHQGMARGGGVGSSPEPEGFVWAWVDASYRIEAEVQSPCTGGISLLASTESNSSTPKHQGTDDISILVGKCDG